MVEVGLPWMVASGCRIARFKIFLSLLLEHFQFFYRRNFVLWRRMEIPHGHLDVCVAGEFTEGGKINAGHGHTSQSSVTKIVETEVGRNSCSEHGGLVSFTHASDRLLA